MRDPYWQGNSPLQRGLCPWPQLEGGLVTQYCQPASKGHKKRHLSGAEQGKSVAELFHPPGYRMPALE